MTKSTSLNIFFVFALVLLSFSISSVQGHGLLCFPRQRGSYYDSRKCGVRIPINVDKKEVRDYCNHCVNGGGVGVVQSNLPGGKWTPYDPINDPTTTRRASLCGDMASSRNRMIGGKYMPYSTVPITARWKVGSAVDIDITLTANHIGYFEFFLCNLDDCGTTDIDEKCFRDGHCHRLQRVSIPTCQAPNASTIYTCGPVDLKHPSRWYVPCRDLPQRLGGKSGTMRYGLPAGVTCKHCVLQCHWTAAQNCNPPGFIEYFNNYNKPFGTTCDSDAGPGAHQPKMGGCSSNRIPEEYWSCADVQISKNGSGDTSIPVRTPRPNVQGCSV